MQTESDGLHFPPCVLHYTLTLHEQQVEKTQLGGVLRLSEEVCDRGDLTGGWLLAKTEWNHQKTQRGLLSELGTGELGSHIHRFSITFFGR